MSEEIKYVHHDIKNAVFDLVCLVYPYAKSKSLINNLHKDCKDQIKVYEREHKALEIIKRLFNVTASYNSTCEEYTIYISPKPNKVAKAMMNVATKDEVDLMKEVLK